MLTSALTKEVGLKLKAEYTPPCSLVMPAACSDPMEIFTGTPTAGVPSGYRTTAYKRKGV